MSLDIDAYNSFLRCVEASSIDLEKAVQLIEKELYDELRELILRTPYGREGLLEPRNIVECEQQISSIVSSTLEEVLKYAPEEVKELIMRFSTYIEVLNLFLVCQDFQKFRHILIPYGIVYKCVVSYTEKMDIIKCLEREFESLGVPELRVFIEYIEKHRLAEAIDLGIKMIIRVMYSLIELIDSLKHFESASETIREWLGLQLAKMLYTCREVGCSKDLLQFLRDVLGVENPLDIRWVLFNLGITRGEAIDFIQKLYSKGFSVLDELKFVSTTIMKCRVPGDNLDMLAYILLLKVYEPMVVRAYIYSKIFRGIKA